MKLKRFRNCSLKKLYVIIFTVNLPVILLIKLYNCLQLRVNGIIIINVLRFFFLDNYLKLNFLFSHQLKTYLL